MIKSCLEANFIFKIKSNRNQPFFLPWANFLLQFSRYPQNSTKRVSVTSAKTFFSLKDWAKMKSESSIIYVTMEKKHSGQAPTLGL